MCVCVFCVFFLFILDIKFVRRTSRGHTGGRSHGISHPPSFCGACLNFSREKDSAIFLSLVDREVEFCVLTIQSFSTRCCCCCCCLHIKSRSGLYSVPSNIRTGPTDADAFRGHRLTTQKGYTYQKEIKGPRKVNTLAIIGK